MSAAPELVLYHVPGGCSRVSLNALEEAGLSYHDELINVLTGEQHSEAYRRINPKAKVPALIVDGELLTENAAIQMYVDRLVPEAGILPPVHSALDKARQYADLIWCSSTLHPAVRQVRVPVRFTTADPTGVVERGREYVEALLTELNTCFAEQAFWYGETWSIMDVYLYWCYSTAGGSEVIALENYPHVLSHAERVHERPSYQRALKRELAAMDRSGMVLPGGMTLS